MSPATQGGVSEIFTLSSTALGLHVARTYNPQLAVVERLDCRASHNLTRLEAELVHTLPAANLHMAQIR